MEEVIVGQEPRYPLPDLRLLPPNGSYGDMYPVTISQIYRRCYNAQLHHWQWLAYDEGRFFSRFDKYPYWCRDMLAFRAALRNSTPWTKKVIKLRSFLTRTVRNVERVVCNTARNVEGVVNDACWKVHDDINHWFLDDEDLPAEMRHLWSF